MKAHHPCREEYVCEVEEGLRRYQRRITVRYRYYDKIIEKSDEDEEIEEEDQYASFYRLLIIQATSNAVESGFLCIQLNIQLLQSQYSLTRMPEAGRVNRQLGYSPVGTGD